MAVISAAHTVDSKMIASEHSNYPTLEDDLSWIPEGYEYSPYFGDGFIRPARSALWSLRLLFEDDDTNPYFSWEFSMKGTAPEDEVEFAPNNGLRSLESTADRLMEEYFTSLATLFEEPEEKEHDPLF